MVDYASTRKEAGLVSDRLRWEIRSVGDMDVADHSA